METSWMDKNVRMKYKMVSNTKNKWYLVIEDVIDVEDLDVTYFTSRNLRDDDEVAAMIPIECGIRREASTRNKQRNI